MANQDDMQRTNELGQPIGPSIGGWTPPQPPSDRPITGARCRLERFELSRHGRELFEAYQGDSVGRNWTYLGYGPFSTYEAYHDWAGASCVADDPLFFAIRTLDLDRAVGVASYLRINPAMGSIEVGHINLSPLLQRTPAATEAMYLMMRHAFDSGYRRYEWKCDALNEPSRRAAARIGFRYEGTFRQSVVYKGRNRDSAWYSIVDTEWPALRRCLEQWLAPENFDSAGRQRTALSERVRQALGDRQG
jgi:RimJ/RimL family protein N-acetyltransferase